MDERTGTADLERRLADSEARHRLLIDTWAQAVWETDAGGVVVADSPSWRAYTGQTLEEWLGYGWLDAVHPDDRPYAGRQWREAIAARGLVNAEFRLRSSRGGWRWTNIRAAPVLGAVGHVEKWVGINIDIDGRKRAEAALRESEQKYRKLFENLGQGYAECELIRGTDGHAVDVRYLALNPALERLSGGLKAADMIGRPAREVIPNLEETHATLYERIVDGGVPERVEYEVAALGRWYECYVYPIKGDRFISLYEDITERKRAEARLRESKERQIFLLKLSDALRRLSDPVEVQEVASRMVGEHLKADRVSYSEVDGDELVVHRDYAPGAPSMVGRYPKASFGRKIEGALGSSGMVWANDVQSSPELSDSERAAFRVASIAAYVGSTLYKDGRFAGAFGLHQTTPRVWTEDDISLVEDVAERIWAATTRARMEAALRESEERQAFLLRLSDALRPLAHPQEIKDAATRVLGQHLDVLRAQYWEADETAEFLVSNGGYANGVAPVTAHIRMDDFGHYVKDSYRAGTIMAVADVETDPRVSPEELKAYDALGFRAWAGVPLVKAGKLVAALGLHNATRREWTATEIELARETAERTWAAVERAWAEAAVRQSEERLRQFGEASSDVLWIRNAETYQWEYLTPAFEAIYGIDRAAALAGDNMANWVDLIEPEDRERAIEGLRRVREGERVSFEYRIRRPSDGAIRWLRNTDFPMRDAAGEVCWIGGVGRDITDEKETADRMQVLVAELQHRTRNLMGVVRSTAEKTMARSNDLIEFRDRFGDRLSALARVQGLLSRLGEWDRVTFDELIRSELSAIDGEAERISLEGPGSVALRSSTVQTLALALHELMTNALKYGALAQPEGRLSIAWRVEQAEEDGRPWLHVDWRETGVTMPADMTPRGGGSGRDLITRALPYQLKARTTYVMAEDGVHCTIALPVSQRSTGLDATHA